MRIVVAGATGRTGREVLAVARERGHAVDGVATTETAVDGVDVRPADELADRLADADALVDFTVPEASRSHAGMAADAGVAYVVGTTGFNQQGTADLRGAADRIPVLKASNFARGVQALLDAVADVVRTLDGYDIELTETHHNGKRDAPSGTATTLLDRIDAVVDDLDRTYGREGHQPRGNGEVGVHVRRAGNVRGEHELLLAGNDEVVTLTHRAESRRVFAAGAVDAAEWLVGRDPGWYNFADAL